MLQSNFVFFSDLSANKDKLDKAKKRLKTARGRLEEARVDFEDAERKFHACERKVEWEQKNVNNLSNIRETLLKANQLHIERDLQQGCFVFFLVFAEFRFLAFSQVPLWLIEFRFSLKSNRRRIWLNTNEKHNMMSRMQASKSAMASLITAPPRLFSLISYTSFHSFLSPVPQLLFL